MRKLTHFRIIKSSDLTYFTNEICEWVEILQGRNDEVEVDYKQPILYKKEIIHIAAISAYVTTGA
jgi:hypothetical protein